MINITTSTTASGAVKYYISADPGSEHNLNGLNELAGFVSDWQKIGRSSDVVYLYSNPQCEYDLTLTPTTVVINGVTYPDGSALFDAVESIIFT